MSGSPEDRPTFVEYGYGDGAVLATTQTIEWPYESSNGTRELLQNALDYTPGDLNSINLDGLIAGKSNTIDRIQSLAGLTLGDEEASSTVDQRAQELLDWIDRNRVNADTETRRQYQEALERMNAAESVTRTATATVVGSDSPIESILSNIYSLVTGVAIEGISMATGGLLRGAVDSMITSFTRRADEMLSGMSGRYSLQGRVARRLSQELNSATTSNHYAMRRWGRDNPDEVETMSEAMASATYTTIRSVGMEVSDALVGNDTILDAIEELVFTAYYFRSDGMTIDPFTIPTPDEIEIPDINVTYDVPDEELPGWARGAVPDEISHRIESPDIDLPDLEPLETMNRVADEVADLSRGGGIDATIDERMAHLEDVLTDDELSLAEQPDDTRDVLESFGVEAIQRVSDYIDRLLQNITNIQDLFSDSAQLATYLLVFAIGLAAVLIYTGIGTAGMLTIAGLLAGVVTVLSVVNLILDGVQIFAGMAYLEFLRMFHHYTTWPMAETDLSSYGGIGR